LQCCLTSACSWRTLQFKGTSVCVQLDKSPQLMRGPLGCVTRPFYMRRFFEVLWLPLAGLAACTQRGSSARAVSPQPLPPALEREVLGAALDGLARPLSLDAPYCITLERNGKTTEPDSRWLASLETQREVVPRRACPPTYGSMIQVVDSLGRPVGPHRPSGYIDPYQLTVAGPVAVSSEQAAVRVHAWQGTRFWVIYCDVYLPKPRTTAECGAIQKGVS
jgi:hypothetical protein